MGLILMRHTTPHVAKGVCYGRLDLPPGPDFKAEADAALTAIPAPPTRIITSPLIRCARLAEVAARRYGLASEPDPRLRELDFGQWEGRAWGDIPRDEIDAWAADLLDASPHGGETVRAMQTRVTEALTHYSNTDGICLIITHAGVLKVVTAMQGHPDPWGVTIPFGGHIYHD